MESKIFKTNSVYDSFRKEWIAAYSIVWSEFIEEKDIGIKAVEDSIFLVTHEYEVIDEKKWLIARIKYGI